MPTSHPKRPNPTPSKINSRDGGVISWPYQELNLPFLLLSSKRIVDDSFMAKYNYYYLYIFLFFCIYSRWRRSKEKGGRKITNKGPSGPHPIVRQNLVFGARHHKGGMRDVNAYILCSFPGQAPSQNLPCTTFINDSLCLLVTLPFIQPFCLHHLNSFSHTPLTLLPALHTHTWGIVSW